MEVRKAFNAKLLFDKIKEYEEFIRLLELDKSVLFRVISREFGMHINFKEDITDDISDLYKDVNEIVLSRSKKVLAKLKNDLELL